jgi:hypothetical protein
MMSRIASLVFSVSLLLVCLLPSQQALANGPDNPAGAPICEANDETTLQACAMQLRNYGNQISDGQGGTVLDQATEIMITGMIECSSPTGCRIMLTNTQPSPSVTITGDPSQQPSQVGFHRTASYGYSLIQIVGWSNVTISNFTIYDQPLDALGRPLVAMSVDGASGSISCGRPSGNSTVASEQSQAIPLGPTDTGVPCWVPGYVTTLTQVAPDPSHPNAPTTDYSDFNVLCFNATLGHGCPADILVTGISHKDADGNVVIDSYATNVTISGLTIENSESDAVDFGSVDGFHFLDNRIDNSYYRGLAGAAKNASIENNYFFANRAAALNVVLSSSSDKRPSDVSFNTFNHNQHGDAFPCNGNEGCSGGQLGITGSDFVFYGNTFLNGFDDFYDPEVFGENFGYDAFVGCDLSAQCAYHSSPGVLNDAGQLWQNGGGVETGPEYHGVPNDGQHETPDVELTGPVSGDVVFANNYLDYGTWAVSYDKYDTIPDSGLVQIYNNQMFGNALGIYKHPFTYYEIGNCGDAGCGAPDGVMPVIIAKGPNTVATERGDCGAVNCIWTTATEAWAPSNSLALGSNGTQIKCALLVYGPGGSTLLATIQGASANCTTGEGIFTIPGSVAQHYTSVQLAFKNLATGQVSPKQSMTLVGMTPTITAASACSNNNCISLTVTDGYSSCAVGLYNPTTNALLANVTGSAVTCNGSAVTAIIPTSLRGAYGSFNVNYQNLTQGTWSPLKNVPMNGTGGGGGGGGCDIGVNCQQP